MKRVRLLPADEIQAVLHSLRNEPPGRALRELAPAAKWWTVRLSNIEELGSLRTLWHKKSYNLTESRDARAPTVSQTAQRILNGTFRRPGLQAKVTRYVNRARSRDVETRIVLEETPWGMFIVDGTTRAVALYLLHVRNEDLRDLFPVKVIVFSL